MINRLISKGGFTKKVYNGFSMTPPEEKKVINFNSVVTKYLWYLKEIMQGNQIRSSAVRSYYVLRQSDP